MSLTSSIALAVGLVLLGIAVVALAIRRHRGGRHRAPEPMATVLAARTGVGAVAVGSMASSVLVLVGHGAGTGSTVQAAERAPRGALETAASPEGTAPDARPVAAFPDRTPAVAPVGSAPRADRAGGGYVVVPPPRSPVEHRGDAVPAGRRPVERHRPAPRASGHPDPIPAQRAHHHSDRHRHPEHRIPEQRRTGEHRVRGHRAEVHRTEVHRTEVRRDGSCHAADDSGTRNHRSDDED